MRPPTGVCLSRQLVLRPAPRFQPTHAQLFAPPDPPDPARRFAHVQHLEPECLSLSLHLSQGARPPATEATPLRVSRALEQRVADVEGPADVRHWLQLIGHGEEHEWIDLGTVGGWPTQWVGGWVCG